MINYDDTVKLIAEKGILEVSDKRTLNGEFKDKIAIYNSYNGETTSEVSALYVHGEKVILCEGIGYTIRAIPKRVVPCNGILKILCSEITIESSFKKIVLNEYDRNRILGVKCDTDATYVKYASGIPGFNALRRVDDYIFEWTIAAFFETCLSKSPTLSGYWEKASMIFDIANMMCVHILTDPNVSIDIDWVITIERFGCNKSRIYPKPWWLISENDEIITIEQLRQNVELSQVEIETYLANEKDAVKKLFGD
jgi:hypothetical protein